jgi:hypothetical protein
MAKANRYRWQNDKISGAAPGRAPDADVRDRQRSRLASRSGPVTTRFVDPASLPKRKRRAPKPRKVTPPS